MSETDKKARSIAETAAIYASVKRLVRCPWNPFPEDSPWGRQIDEGYRADRRRQIQKKGRRIFRPIYTDLTDDELEAAGEDCREHFADSTLISSSAEL